MLLNESIFVLRLYDLLNKGRVCDDVWMSLRRCGRIFFNVEVVHEVLICHFTEITGDNYAFVTAGWSLLSKVGHCFFKSKQFHFQGIFA